MALNIGYAVQEIGFYTQMLACHNVKYSQVKSSSLDLIISKFMRIELLPVDP